MDPSSTQPVPYQSFVQFRQCKNAAQLIKWHRTYTPWMFLLQGNDQQHEVQKQLYSVYDKQFKQIEEQQTMKEQIDTLADQIVDYMIDKK